MAVKNLFWLYIGIFFASGFAMIALVKRYAKAFSGNGLKPALFGILAAVIFGGLAFLSTLSTFNLYPIFWILTGTFIVFGVFHILVFHKKYFYEMPGSRGQVIIGEILFSLALIFFSVVAFSVLIYFFSDKPFPYYPMLMSMLAFFVPVALYYTFESAYNIPEPVFATWVYPIHQPIDLPDERAGEKLVVMAFEIAKKVNSPVKTNFRAKSPDTMILGDLYYHFINDYNELHSETTIEFSDGGYNSHEWWFRIRPKWYQFNRVLDPQLTLRENKIRENTVIICERIQTN